MIQFSKKQTRYPFFSTLVGRLFGNWRPHPRYADTQFWGPRGRSR